MVKLLRNFVIQIYTLFLEILLKLTRSKICLLLFIEIYLDYTDLGGVLTQRLYCNEGVPKFTNNPTSNFVVFK